MRGLSMPDLMDVSKGLPETVIENELSCGYHWDRRKLHIVV